MTKIQKATLLLMMLYFSWEGAVQFWEKNETSEAIRVDLLLIYPILILLILISTWQFLKK